MSTPSIELAEKLVETVKQSKLSKVHCVAALSIARTLIFSDFNGQHSDSQVHHESLLELPESLAAT